MSKNIKTPPRLLNNSARNYYNTIVKFMRDKGAFEKIDFYTVAMAANALTLYHQALEQVMEYGSTQTFKTGASNVTGAYTVMKDQAQLFQQFSDRLGLDVKARERLQAYAKKENENPFEKIINNKAS